MALPEPKPTSPFTAGELAGWRRCLHDQRQALVDDIAHLSCETYSGETVGSADPTTVAQPQELAIEELDEARLMLAQIDAALAKIDGRGALAYGICEETGAIIERERLELMPWTPLSSRGARLRERAPAPFDPT